jgi:hypothetical protein
LSAVAVDGWSATAGDTAIEAAARATLSILRVLTMRSFGHRVGAKSMIQWTGLPAVLLVPGMPRRKLNLLITMRPLPHHLQRIVQRPNVEQAALDDGKICFEAGFECAGT